MDAEKKKSVYACPLTHIYTHTHSLSLSLTHPLTTATTLTHCHGPGINRTYLKVDKHLF